MNYYNTITLVSSTGLCSHLIVPLYNLNFCKAQKKAVSSDLTGYERVHIILPTAYIFQDLTWLFKKEINCIPLSNLSG